MKALLIVAALVLVILHPWAVLAAVLAVELAVLAVAGSRIMRAAGIRFPRRKWEPWTP